MHAAEESAVGKQRRGSRIVLAALAALYAWGHWTHWTFGYSAEPWPAAPTAVAPAPTTPRSSNIRLPSAKTAEQMGIELAGVEVRTLTRELTVPARVSYEQGRVAQLTSRAPGTVWRALKRVGQPIARGEVLAIIDSTTVGKAKSEYLHARAGFELKQRVVQRLKPLGDRVVPLKQIEVAESELRSARFELFNTEQMLINLGLPVDADKLAGLSDEEVMRQVKFLGLPESITRSLDPHSATANLLPLFAPFDGLVIGQDIANGEVVSTLDHGFEVADISHMAIKLSLREEDVEQIRLRQPVNFTVGQTEISTSISWISTEVDPKTRTVEARCDTENPRLLDVDGNPTAQFVLRANMFVAARVRVEQKSGALVVPTRAVQTQGANHLVFVRSGDRDFEVRRVDLGIATEQLTEVLDGLSAGERVATEGSHILKCEVQRSHQPDGA